PDQGRGARGREMGGGDIDRADQGEDARRALEEAPGAGDRRVPAREEERADSEQRRADGDDPARPELVHRNTGDEAEGRVAEVEQADQRGEANGAEAEGLR